MTKKLFIETIEQIKKQEEYDDSVALNLSKVFPDAFQANLLPKNHLLKNQLVKILQIELNDNHSESWIEYFMFELDFGRDYHVGCVTQKDGSNIDLSTSSKLYDFLIE